MHGTAVALLIAAVAPDVKLDFYGICDEYGRPQPGPLKHALELATASDVTIINLSAGRSRTWQETLEVHRGLPSAFHAIDRDNLETEEEECLWCLPADEVAAHGKLIVASVGNNEQRVYCPARSPNVIATGFHVDQRYLTSTEGGEPYEQGKVNPPEGYSQSSEVAFTISQPMDAIGSSFASPLLSGAIALGIPQMEIPNWFAAARIGTQAGMALHSEAASQKVTQLLAYAWSKVPHNHFAEPNPEPCFECGLFLEELYTVESLLWLTEGNAELAHQRLTTTQRIMPWSPHAFVNYGNLLERVIALSPDRADAQELITTAIQCYQIALRSSPPSLIAAQRLAELSGRL